MLSKSDYRYFKKAKMAATISDYKKTHLIDWLGYRVETMDEEDYKYENY